MLRIDSEEFIDRSGPPPVEAVRRERRAPCPVEGSTFLLKLQAKLRIPWDGSLSDGVVSRKGRFAIESSRLDLLKLKTVTARRRTSAPGQPPLNGSCRH
jgi:hypothetical protein